MNRLHDYSVNKQDVMRMHMSMFSFPGAATFWNSLHAECFSLTYLTLRLNLISTFYQWTSVSQLTLAFFVFFF